MKRKRSVKGSGALRFAGLRFLLRRLRGTPLLVGLFLIFLTARAQPPTGELAPGGRLDGELPAGATVRHKLTLGAGAFFEIEASSTDADLVARLSQPDGSPHSVVDLSYPPHPEVILGVANTGGSWILELEAAEGSAVGTYQLFWKTNRAATDRDRLRAQSRIAWLKAAVARGNGETEAAIPLMDESIRLLEQARGPSPTLAERLQDLASAYLELKQYQSAEEVQRRALDLYQRFVPDDWERLGLGRGQLSLALEGQQRYGDAIEAMRESLADLEKVDPPNLDQLVQAHGGLAGLYYQQASYEEARQALVKAAELLQRRANPADGMLAMVLNNLGAVEETLEDFEAAERTYREALETAETVFGPDHEQVAVTLNNLAFLFERQGRYPEAEEGLQRSAGILEARLGPQDPNLAQALNNLAALHKLQGRYDEAEALYLRVKKIFLESHGENHEDTAGIFGNLGNLYYTQGRFSEAEPNLLSALRILRQVAGEHPLTANALNNLADLYRSQGRHEEAERLFRQSLSMYEATLGEDSLEAITPRANLATMYVERGRFAEAEVVFSQSAQVIESRLGPKHTFLALTLNNLGNVYLEQGRMSDAEARFRRAIDIWESNYGEEHAEVASGTQNLAQVYFATGRFEEAESLMNKALRIRRAVLPENHPEIAESLDFRADFHLDRGNFKAAIEDYRAALSLSMKALGSDHPSVGLESEKLGRALLETGQVAEARQRLQRAVQILKERGSFPQSLIRSQSALARLEKRDGNPELARTLLASALEEAEKLRPGVGGGEETRAGFLERVSKEFELMVDWQIEAGHPGTAFEYAERSRARALLDQLSLSGVDLLRSLPPALRSNLENRESKARAEVAELQQRIRFLQSRGDLEASEREARIRALSNRLRSADHEFERIYEEIKSSSPVWTGLLTTAGDTVSLTTVRQELVADQRALLLFQIGGENSYLFLVSAKAPGLQYFHLRLGADAGQAGVVPGPLTAAKLSQLVGAGTQGGMGVMSQLAQFPKLSQLLAHALVPPEAWDRIRRFQEVVLIPDGILHFLPFEMLVLGGAAEETGPSYWLDEGPVVRYASSATTLLNLERRRGHPATGVLSLSDPRFGMPSSAADPTPDSPTARSGMMGPALDDLPGTAEETNHIREAFPSTRVLQREAATEANLRQAIANQAILHLATHGLVDESRNGLFSALALTHPPRSADSNDDGLLQLYEIYDLDLSGVELAVLSACQTNVGNSADGDGVFGLSRGFLAAGARRVIASQWRVDDESTAELIGSFFERLARRVSAGEAIDYANLLREAKRKVKRDPRWGSPIFWAPLIFVGAR